MIGALIVAMLVGLFNGFVVAVVGISSFVATLGTLFTLDGLTLIISHATQVTTPGTSVVQGGDVRSDLRRRAPTRSCSGRSGSSIVLQLVLSFTRWGIYTVAVGGNRLGAAEAGVKDQASCCSRNFVLCAALAGFVGILEAVRASTSTPDPSGANAILFQAISAAVIGGTLLQRRRRAPSIGALIGAIFLGILQDGLTIKGVNANYLYFYLGLAILIAMAFNIYVSRVRTGSGRG